MKHYLFGSVSTILVFALLLVVLHRLGKAPRHAATAPDLSYQKALSSSAEQAATPENAQQQEAWLQPLRNCFGVFSVENLQQTTKQTYAEQLYFRDAFHHFSTRDELERYLIESAEISPGVTFTYAPATWNGFNAYLPWTMHLPPKGNQNQGQQSLGLTHLRFDASGRVIFHQDYWDSADVLVPRVPVANGLIELVRRRF